MTLRIEYEPFDIEDKDRCSHVIAILVPLFQRYYETIKQPGDPEFNFNFMEFVKDWWHGEKVLIIAYDNNTPIGYLYAKTGGNLYTSLPEMRVKSLYCDLWYQNKTGYHTDITEDEVKRGLIEHAKQLLPLFKCVRLTGVTDGR